jgi:hypothetical protein
MPTHRHPLPWPDCHPPLHSNSCPAVRPRHSDVPPRTLKASSRTHPVHRYRRIVTSRVVGRQPSGSCASSRVTVSRGLPAHPQRRHQPWVPSSASRTRHARTARSGSRRWPTTTRPSSSRRQNVVRSGQPKAASGTSRSSRWAALEPPSSEDLDTYPGDRRASHHPTSETTSTVKSRFTPRVGRRG